jgi:hypothetical protein
MIAASTLRFLLNSIAASLPPFARRIAAFQSCHRRPRFRLANDPPGEEASLRGDRSARLGENGSPHQAPGGSEGTPSTAARHPVRVTLVSVSA